MARLFTAANFEYLSIDSPAGIPEPFTMACWFRMNDVTANHALMWVGDKDVANHEHFLMAEGNRAGDPIRASSRDSGGFPNARTSTGYSADTWHHAAGVWAATNDRAAFLDGGGKGTNATNVTVNGEDRTALGRRADSTPSGHADGRIAEAAIWSVALTDQEIAALASGVSPRHMRPGSLAGYWPLFAFTGNAPDFSGNDLTLVDNNTVTTADHAPVSLFTPRWAAGIPLIETAAGGGFAHSQAVIIS